jgi:hypothetical protein
MRRSYEPTRLPEVVEIRRTWTGPDADSTGLWDLLNYRVSLQLGYAFASLFWPDFVEVGSALLLAEKYSPEAYQQWFTYFAGDLEKVEAMINHTHTGDLFLNATGDNDLPSEVWTTFLDVLADCWRACVSARYPGEDIVVETNDESGGEVTIYRRRDSR